MWCFGCCVAQKNAESDTDIPDSMAIGVRKANYRVKGSRAAGDGHEDDRQVLEDQVVEKGQSDS